MRHRSRREEHRRGVSIKVLVPFIGGTSQDFRRTIDANANAIEGFVFLNLGAEMSFYESVT